MCLKDGRWQRLGCVRNLSNRWGKAGVYEQDHPTLAYPRSVTIYKSHLMKDISALIYILKNVYIVRNMGMCAPAVHEYHLSARPFYGDSEARLKTGALLYCTWMQRFVQATWRQRRENLQIRVKAISGASAWTAARFLEFSYYLNCVILTVRYVKW